MAVAGDPRGYYRALGIERTASADDIRTAFRLRAKSLHPDQGGGSADQEPFRLLLEAYESLRDPQQRLRYDADSLAAERRTFDRDWAGAAASSPSDADTGASAGRQPQDAALEPRLREAAAFLSTHAVPLLALALLVATGLAVLGWSRAAERGRELATLTHRLDAARAQTIKPMEGAELPQVYRTELRFPAGLAELDAAARGRLAAVTADLRRAVTALPQGSDWLVAVEGVIERAADRDGLLVEAWELALLRVGVTAQYLVGHGIPAERVSVRFHAGALLPGQGQPQPHGVALALFCCLPVSTGG